MNSRREVEEALAKGVKDFSDETLVDLDLDGIVFRDCSLADISFCGATVRGARFESVEMASADFVESKADGALFRGCTAAELEFTAASLRAVRFEDCSFERVFLADAEMSEFVCLRTKLVEANLLDSTLLSARFHATHLVGCVLGRADGSELQLTASKVEGTQFNLLRLPFGSLAGTRFVGVRFDGCDLSEVDLRGASLDGADFRTSKGVNNFTGAKYNSSTKFPDGFDPVAVGMVRVADFTPEEEAELMWREPTESEDDSGEEAQSAGEETVLTKEGFFIRPSALEALICDEPSLRNQVGGTSWPPRGYTGAAEDAVLALKLEELLRDCVEGSATDSSYFAFVVAPGASIPGEEEALDDQMDSRLGEAGELLGVNPKSFEEEDAGQEVTPEGDGVVDTNVFLHSDAEELSVKSKNWWKKFYSKNEYRARVQTGELMQEELNSLSRDQVPYGKAWSHALYMGWRESGARVGVMAVRFDEEDDG